MKKLCQVYNFQANQHINVVLIIRELMSKPAAPKWRLFVVRLVLNGAG